MTLEAWGQVVGVVLAAGIAGWVRFDAVKRGFTPAAALGWSLGVFLMMILFLPGYLWARRGTTRAASTLSPSRAAPPIAGVPCPYCGYTNAGNPDYCGKCGRQMRSSTEIHR